jgi:uncharacterized protein (DUF1684 family)
VAVVGCAENREPPARGLEAKDEPAWRAQLARDRADKDHQLAVSPESALAASDRFTPVHAAFLRLEGDKLQLDDAEAPTSLIAFEPTDATAQRWTWRPLAAAMTNGKPPPGPTPITRPMRVQVSPRFAVAAQLVGGSLVINGFDRQRKELAEFKQLSYFEPDPKFVVSAKLERFEHPTPIDLATSRGLKKPYVRYGFLRFELDGTPCVLTAFRPAGSPGPDLFVPFRDATSGKTTYGAARFLDLEEPADKAARLTIDFNQAYNPYCAYSDAYNCPMPPPENQLTVAVTAGEKAFGAHH